MRRAAPALRPRSTTTNSLNERYGAVRAPGRRRRQAGRRARRSRRRRRPRARIARTRRRDDRDAAASCRAARASRAAARPSPSGRPRERGVAGGGERASARAPARSDRSGRGRRRRRSPASRRGPSRSTAWQTPSARPRSTSLRRSPRAAAGRRRRPSTAPARHPATPPPTAATSVGAPCASRCAPATAPTATNAPWASDGSPATPTTSASADRRRRRGTAAARSARSRSSITSGASARRRSRARATRGRPRDAHLVSAAAEPAVTRRPRPGARVRKGEEEQTERRAERRRGTRGRRAQCVDVTVAWTSPSTTPATKARRGSNQTTTAAEQAVEPVPRCSVRVERARRGGEDGGQARPDAGERECDPDEAPDGQADEDRRVEVLGDRLESSPEARALEEGCCTGGEDEARPQRRTASAPGSSRRRRARSRRRPAGGTAAGRGRRRRRGRRTRRAPFGSTNATASDAATQPIVEPRARYGSIARKYDPALAAAVTTRPTTRASRNRRPRRSSARPGRSLPRRGAS